MNKIVKRWKGVLLLFSVLIVIIIFNKRDQYITEYFRSDKDIKVQQNVLSVHNYSEKEKKVIKKEEDKIIGTNCEGRKYTCDAKKIKERINSGNYFNNGEKIVFLTFDDGSSTTVTPKILRILKEKNVKATFFLTGKIINRGGTRAKQLVKQIFNSGHAIGNHSYSHSYSILYPKGVLDIESFKKDFKKNEDLLKDILGENFSTRVLRCPGGYRTWKGMKPLDEYLNKNNKVSIDWNALSKDAEGEKKDAQELVNCAIHTSRWKYTVVLLMHDAAGKEETAKSLPKIIEYFRNKGYKFKTLS